MELAVPLLTEHQPDATICADFSKTRCSWEKLGAFGVKLGAVGKN
jgi:hypothetical protein